MITVRKNFRFTESIAEKLKYLSEYNGLKENATLSVLISGEYERIVKFRGKENSIRNKEKEIDEKNND